MKWMLTLLVLIQVCIGVDNYYGFNFELKPGLLRYQLPALLYKNGYTSIDLIKLREGHYYLFVYIRGEAYKIMIDTGAQGSMINLSLAKKIGLRKLTGLKVYGIHVDGVDFRGDVGYIDSIKVGTFMVDYLLVIAYPDKSTKLKRQIGKELEKRAVIRDNKIVEVTGQLDDNIDGILGDDFLTYTNAIIDLKHLKLYLKKISETNNHTNAPDSSSR